ncbi:MAG TPA: ATP-binding cassette domain-containing protein [Roseiflexaceae bacterium]|nr:ATP-binding cassette domain-containing protein [Roseiflexaceae bacterium]
MAGSIIVARGLSRRYGSIVALDGVDLNIAEGTVYALLGPNGAGKTTLINLLTTLMLPHAGSAQIAGYDVVRQAAQVRRLIGVTFQELILDRDLTGRQVLDIHARLYRLSPALRRQRITELIALVQLEEAIDRQVKGYSGGMQRRLELARGLMTEPQVLFLDEPTQGLDPQNRHAIWEYLQVLKRERGLTLLLTTHYMEEAEALADVVGIIDHGRMVVEGSPAALIGELGADVVRIVGSGDTAAFLEHMRAMPYIGSITHDLEPGAIMFGVEHGTRRLAEIIAQAHRNGFTISDIEVRRPTLGEVFLKHTGVTLRS